MRKACLLWGVLAGLLLGIAAGAQNPPPAGAESVIRTTVTEVLLDLVVRDKNGRLVKNLKPSEVEIYEDGVRRQLVGFRQVEGPRALERRAGSRTPPARELRSVNPVCIVFHNLGPVARKRAIEAVREFLANNFPPETYAGLFVLDDHLRPVYPFTNNRVELMQAVESAFARAPLDFARASEALLTANPNQVTIAAVVDMAARTATTTVRLSGGEVSPTVITRAEVSTGSGANALRGDQVLERGTFSHIAGMRATDQVITMVRLLGTLPGRKTVLLLTTGLVTTGDPERFASILSEANASGLTIYALDAQGLEETSTAQAGEIALGRVADVSKIQSAVDSPLSVMRQKSRQIDDLHDAVRASDVQASLRALSEGTGGFLIANTNDFRKPFQRIVEDMGWHYEAAFRPASDKYDGRLRKIEVRLARPGLHVESRTGYFAVPDLKGWQSLAPFETLALAVLNATPPPRAFDFRAAAFDFPGGALSRHVLAFEVPGAGLAAQSDEARKIHRLHLSLLALVKRPDGQIVDKFSLDAPYEIPDANLAAIRSGAVTYTHPVALPPGRYVVESAVIDRLGGRSSTSAIPLEAPEPRRGVSVSSVLLVRQIEPAGGQADASDPLVAQGKRAIPLLETALKPGAKPYVYFVVYPDQANPEKPRILVEFLLGGRVLARQAADLPPADASGTIPMMVEAATRPGDCELRITALQGNDSSTQAVRYNVPGP